MCHLVSVLQVILINTLEYQTHLSTLPRAAGRVLSHMIKQCPGRRFRPPSTYIFIRSVSLTRPEISGRPRLVLRGRYPPPPPELHPVEPRRQRLTGRNKRYHARQNGEDQSSPPAQEEEIGNVIRKKVGISFIPNSRAQRRPPPSDLLTKPRPPLLSSLTDWTRASPSSRKLEGPVWVL